MATTTPDPKKFASWNDAFSHPVPQTRKFEQALRTQAEQDRQKLRTIVGASYRDLLGTADRIIEMDGQIQLVEDSLGVAGRLCNSKALERIFVNSGGFIRGTGTGTGNSQKRMGIASQFALLQGCIAVISRLLRKDDSALVASKVYVLSRLLHKTLSQSEPESQLLDSIRTRLQSIRRRLLAVIDRRLGNPDATWRSLVDDMCAYALTMSATPTDILRHFQSVRLSAIESSSGTDEGNGDQAVKAVENLISTLRVTQAIFPKRLSDALSRLKDVPLLRNKDVVLLDGLDLSLHLPHVADDLKNYTPWPRHDELKEVEAKKQHRQWAKVALKALTDGLRRSLAAMDNVGIILRQREHVFQILPWSENELPGLIVEDVIDEFRSIINDRITTILEKRAQRLDSIVSTLSVSLDELEAKSTANQFLWDDEIASMDGSNGASKFKSTIQSCYQGGDPTSQAFIKQYDAWSDEMSQLIVTIRALKNDKWDNDDVGDDLDEQEGESRQVLLGEDDPRTLEESFNKCLEEALTNLQKGFQDLLPHGQIEPSTSSVQRSIITLRILREVAQRPVTISSSSISPLPAAQTITPLYRLLSSRVLSTPFVNFKASLSRFAATSNLSLISLWEGSPPLPVQPSPSAYKLLRDTNRAMQDLGADIWASGAVGAIKTAAMEQLVEAVSECLEDITQIPERPEVQAQPAASNTDAVEEEAEDKEEDGEGKAAAEDTAKKEEQEEDITEDADSSHHAALLQQKATQLLTDTLYLTQAFFCPSSPSTKSLISSLSSTTSLDSQSITRLERSATEYWRRTYLIFGLLLAT